MLLTPHHGDREQARLMSDLEIMIKFTFNCYNRR